MSVQDDRREEFVRQLFKLSKLEKEGRSGTDAVLPMPNGLAVEFELKSATRKGVTTVRDFGPAHIRKWRGKHWLIGFFDPKGEHLTSCVYASPKQMEPWIREKEEYVRLNWELAELASRVDRNLLESLLVRNFGDKDVYTLEDARRIQKMQYRVAEYKRRMDREGGYSKRQMLEILAERWGYLSRRGATLNNPHIPAKYFKGWDRLPLPSPIQLVLPVPDKVIEEAQKARDSLLREVERALAEEEPESSSA